MTLQDAKNISMSMTAVFIAAVLVIPPGLISAESAYWHTPVPGGKTQAGGNVIVNALLHSVS